MFSIHPHFIIDRSGKRISVVLTIEEYEAIMEELEELEDIRLFDEAKSSDEPGIPAEEAFKQIEAKRKIR
jgi:hypothetical protein